MNQPQASSWQLPPAMADSAEAVDGAYNFIFWFSVVFTVLITVALVYFVMKYKRRPGVKSEPTGHYNKLEIFWTVTPTIFIFFLFHAGFSSYIKNATASEGATEIRVRAKKWAWEFEYPSGDRVAGLDGLHLEVNKPYKMIISSEDVLHDFFVPEFRLKRDAVPGQYSFVAFTPTVVGPAHVFCAEYCGTSHSAMLAKIIIDTHEDYLKFLDTLGKKPEICGVPAGPCTPERWGEGIFVANNCPTCHGVGGTGQIGGQPGPCPPLVGKFGKMEITTAGPVMFDENYVRESILRPNAKIVAGYQNVAMPPYVFKDAQLDSILAYIKSLKK